MDQVVLEAENSVITARLHRPRRNQSDPPGVAAHFAGTIGEIYAVHQQRTVRDVRQRDLLGKRWADGFVPRSRIV